MLLNFCGKRLLHDLCQDQRCIEKIPIALRPSEEFAARHCKAERQLHSKYEREEHFT